jgi:hypothetical protein
MLVGVVQDPAQFFELTPVLLHSGAGLRRLIAKLSELFPNVGPLTEKGLSITTRSFGANVRGPSCCFPVRPICNSRSLATPYRP